MCSEKILTQKILIVDDFFDHSLKTKFKLNFSDLSSTISIICLSLFIRIFSMNFSSSSFFKNMIDDKYEIYLKECLSPLDCARSACYSRYLIQLINQIQISLINIHTQPKLKCKILEFLTYLMLLGQLEICDLVESKILPILQTVCFIDKSLPLSKRGASIFNGQYSSIETDKNTTYGMQYYRRCLQSVMVWAIWLPNKLGYQQHPSLYSKAYRNLRIEGVTFPAESQLNYFKHDYLEKCQNKIRQLEMKVCQVSLKNSIPLGFSLSSQNTGNFWKNQNKHLRENQKQLLDKIQQLQFQISKLTNQLITRDKKIAAVGTPSTTRTKYSDDSQQSPTPSVKPFVGELGILSIVSFEETFSKLPSDQQIRFKKALFRPKYIFYKNEHFQLGCITESLDNRFQIHIHLTNNSLQEFELQNWNFQCFLNLKHRDMNSYPIKLQSKRQIKFTAQVQLDGQNDIMGRISVSFEYKLDQRIFVVHDMLVPVSKFKTTKVLPYKQIFFNEKLAKIIQLNTKVIEDLPQFKSYFQHCKQDIIAKRAQLTFLLEIHGKLMHLVLYKLSHTHLKIEAIYKQGGNMVASTILKELEFALT